MPLTLVQTVAPASEPVTLAEAKLHLRVEVSDDDDLITGLLKAARQYAETVTGRQLMQATWRLNLDAWPDDDEIRVPKPPLQSVSSITYVDTAGATQTVAASDYQVDANSEPGRIVPAYGEVWPAVRDQLNAIAVTYVAGGAAASSVPEGIKAAIKLLLAHWYETREAVITGTIATEVPMAVESLLLQHWTGEYR